MRCVQCDANDQGLSEFRSDGRVPKEFFIVGGDCLCDECYGWGQELEADYNISDELEENDDDES